ncbi:MAG: LptA/OstA family protein [Treponema sp.]|nr:organic solvent tolerance protein OstA [Spirochaetia bacterium]MDD7460378.1 LptA/OstA family protein [Spirochaetales bacterium]MDY5811221.1 LptA/OstA family protein [Treponema sp.]MEE1182106.1 LptA/OstA family protein [Treponema sp.]
MKKLKKLNKFFIAIFFLLSSAAWCEKITFSANKMSGVAGDKNSSTSLKGNAKVNTKNMIINADYIELSGKDFRMIKAEGNVNGKNTESNLDFNCGRLIYDRETKIATLENDVKLTDIENEVVAQAQIIEFNQDTEIAVMQIKINLTQKDNVCTSAYAVYKKKEQILEMSGNPKIIQDGDTFRAQTIKLDMDSQEITLSGRVKGSVETTNNEEDSEEENEDINELNETGEENSDGKSDNENSESDKSGEDKTSVNPESEKSAETGENNE